MSDYTQLPKRDIYNFVGKKLGNRYLILEFVDEGGMGIVYKGTDTQTDESVAIKILHPKFQLKPSDSGFYLKQFFEEGEILKTLRHPNIVSLIDNGIDDDLVFIVMEWLDGCTLADELMQRKLSFDEVKLFVNQICLALEEAHKKKIIHLDIKPKNIFVLTKPDGGKIVKIIDFGLARIIQSTLGSTISRILGTPQYIAPEIYKNEVSHLCDIYSLGILAFEMLTGVMPFTQTQIYALTFQRLNDPPPSVRKNNPEIPEYIDELIKRTLNPLPSKRPQNAVDFYREFHRGSVIHDIEPKRPLSKPVVYIDKKWVPMRKIVWKRVRFNLINILAIAGWVAQTSYVVYFEIPFFSYTNLIFPCLNHMIFGLIAMNIGYNEDQKFNFLSVVVAVLLIFILLPFLAIGAGVIFLFEKIFIKTTVN